MNKRIKEFAADIRGMTLAEVVVTMTLMTILFSMFSSIMMFHIKCQKRLMIKSEMNAVSDMALYQIRDELESEGRSDIEARWSGKEILENYEIQEVTVTAEYPETPELVRIELKLLHKQTGAVHRSFGYARMCGDTAPEKSDEMLINDLAE